MKKLFIALPIIAVTVLFSGCSLYSASSQPAAPIQSQTTPVINNTITIQNFAFSPATITVKKGTTVTWTNNDSAPHQINSATFNSNLFNKGQTFSFTFNEVGTFDYFCAIHPSMIGKVIVE
ncbi:MAG: Blue (Type 1) copper domain protein [Candidatus Moranbacteria bacterium GW2011_GWC2_37_73]|nr:MAG: Plastocyanin [Parcubacteria group bacterium GW2011_GWC1_36_108]KKP99958.1 MAG: Blue (Type 1) copper domain protein [Candidatus Moranbacteria bacterium GW2011_GWD1_36_198]KKQ39647.1 MAG: Blue (Type 1) copper domain protein [Candidatus Moranbacteria bacterium GW2011_GWC2_37_73]HAR99921.1 hypothetical protein [Candidatus Moranbacteria bacterium]HBI51103.1 hypothetical protein [Candidatus Moranbacteria bacterium]